MVCSASSFKWFTKIIKANNIVLSMKGTNTLLFNVPRSSILSIENSGTTIISAPRRIRHIRLNVVMIKIESNSELVTNLELDD